MILAGWNMLDQEEMFDQEEMLNQQYRFDSIAFLRTERKRDRDLS